MKAFILSSLIICLLLAQVNSLTISAQRFVNATCPGNAAIVESYDAGTCTNGVEINIVNGAAHVCYYANTACSGDPTCDSNFYSNNTCVFRNIGSAYNYTVYTWGQVGSASSLSLSLILSAFAFAVILM